MTRLCCDQITMQSPGVQSCAVLRLSVLGVDLNRIWSMTPAGLWIKNVGVSLTCMISFAVLAQFLIVAKGNIGLFEQLLLGAQDGLKSPMRIVALQSVDWRLVCSVSINCRIQSSGVPLKCFSCLDR